MALSEPLSQCLDNGSERELKNLEAYELALDSRLQLLDVASFTEKLHHNINHLDMNNKRKIVKLLIKEILVGENHIEIKHSIPIKESENTNNGKSYLLCTRSD